MAKKKKSLRDKLNAENPEFVGIADGLSVAELEARLSQLAKDLETTEKAKAENEVLNSLKAQVKEEAAPFNDAKKITKMKTKYVIQLIGEKGGSTE